MWLIKMSRFEGKMLAPERSLSAFFDDGKRCLLAVYCELFWEFLELPRRSYFKYQNDILVICIDLD